MKIIVRFLNWSQLLFQDIEVGSVKRSSSAVGIAKIICLLSITMLCVAEIIARLK